RPATSRAGSASAGDTVDPTIQIVTPQQGDSLLTAGNATGRGSDAGAGVARVLGQGDSNPFLDIFLDGSGNFSFPLQVATAGQHTLRIQALDRAGNLAFSTVFFTVSLPTP